jgi:hypothetical protein
MYLARYVHILILGMSGVFDEIVAMYKEEFLMI